VAACVPALAIGSSGDRPDERSRGGEAHSSKAERRFIGNWRLVDWVLRGASGAIDARFAGERPLGRLTYVADGTMWVHLSRRDRGPAAENWYTGTWQVDASARTITHRVQYSFTRNLEGSDQVRNYRLRRNRLLLWIDSGNGSRVELTWVRESRRRGDADRR
jgi:hypothetical protein